jgi:hypothetical protein
VSHCSYLPNEAKKIQPKCKYSSVFLNVAERVKHVIGGTTGTDNLPCQHYAGMPGTVKLYWSTFVEVEYHTSLAVLERSKLRSTWYYVVQYTVTAAHQYVSFWLTQY